MNISKDLFSKHSKAYSTFRPAYPPELFKYLAGLSKTHDLAWDCATGNGQAAVPLAPYFRRLVATDFSEKQLEHASLHPHIEYRKAFADQSGLAEQSVDLTTVAQAFHWLQFEPFFKEVKRVSKPGAHLAVWCYNLVKHSPAIDQIIQEFYTETVGPFWDPERRFVEQGYTNVAVPFEEVPVPQFSMMTDWSLDHLIGYLSTWSATQKWVAEDPSENSAENLRLPLKKVWGSDPTIRLHWPLSVRLFIT